MSNLLLALAPVLLASAATAACPQDGPPPDPFAPYGEERVRDAFDRASPKDRERLIGYLEFDLGHQESFQLACLRHALTLADRDAGLFEDAAPTPHFDPEELAPGQPIARKPISVESSSYRSFAKRLEAARPPRRYRAAWVYDWDLRQPVRLGEPDDPERHFENACLGFPPNLDLAEALVLQALDDGSQREALVAYGNSYTDRNGGVYPGITLYDAWTSGVEMEMPDVDILGLATALLPKLDRRWVAPIPPSEHDELYGALFEEFTPAKQHRGLRESLARTYLASQPVLHDGFTRAHYDPLHGFWEQHSSSPVAAVDDLPTTKTWEKFLTALVVDTGKDPERLQGAINRRVALEQSEQFVVRRLVAVMADLGWFEDES